MLHVLLESGARSTGRRARFTVASAFTHATLIGLAVALTMRDRRATIERFDLEPVVYVAPTAPRPRPTPNDPGRIAAPELPEISRIPLPSVPRLDPSVPIDHTEILSSIAHGTELPTSSSNAVAGSPSDGIYTDRLVDKPVVPRRDNLRPEYPASLRAAGLEGDVRVRFVVDSIGRVELESIAILETTHALFGDAVRRWLQRTRYAPAEVSGRPVRQLVEQRVGFTLRP
jgi:TonB family protein